MRGLQKGIKHFHQLASSAERAQPCRAELAEIRPHIPGDMPGVAGL